MPAVNIPYNRQAQGFFDRQLGLPQGEFCSISLPSGPSSYQVKKRQVTQLD